MTRIDVGRDIATVLATVKPDVALNVLHGRPGEDGTLQGILEILAIPYTHSGVMASAVAMQKDVAKTVFRAAGVPVPEGVVASRFDVARSHVLPPPYVIKPIAEGSSVGVFIVAEDHAHPPAGAHPRGLDLWRPAHRRKIHSRQGVDLRRHGRGGARRDRDRADGTILRL